MFDSLHGATNDTTNTAAEGPAEPESVGGEYLVLRAEIDRLEAKAAALLATVDAKRPWQVDGYASTTAWLTHRGRLRRGRARRLVVEARALVAMPAVSQAYGAGDVSSDQAAELIRVRNAEPDAFAEHEHTLLDTARLVDWVADLRTVCDYWRQAVCQPAHTDAIAPHEARYLSISTTFEGMVKLDGLFDPATGRRILEKLEASTPPPDHRTPGQRRADAFADAVLGYGSAPSHTVLVHLGAGLSAPAFVAARIGTTVLGRLTAERLTCDASIERIVHSPEGRILDHGRSKRSVSAAMKRALIARDRHCRFPGCRRPSWWTDGHHIVHWAHGGDTSIDNLILLCRHHHTLVHEGGFAVEGPGHDPTFRRPDRTILEWHPPPPG